MADINISSQDGLVQATVKQRQETYYLVTEDSLSSIKSKAILADIFLLISSLAWGAYISVILTINSLPENLSDKDPSYLTLVKLETIKNGILVGGIIFTILTICMFIQSFNIVKQIKSGSQVEIPKK